MTNETVGQPGIPMAPSIAPAAPSAAPAAPSYVPGGPVVATAADIARIGQAHPATAAASPMGVDTRTMMLYEANKKSLIVAYLLWVFLGVFGGHNFYLRRTRIAIVQLILSITLIGMMITGFWILVDAFLIPGWVARQNNLLIAQLGGR